jgi:predicted PhzF superfamily epimerase YddE/YHI9
MALPYWHVDAFADRPFAGNQAAVLLLDAWLPDDVLQAIAAEASLPATAFVASGRELRWFTPTREIRLCGHATLACGHVLLGREGGERIAFATREAGELEVRRTADGGCEMALPVIPTAPGEWPEAARALVDVPWDIRRSPDRYAIFRYAHEDEIYELEPELKALAALGDDQFICTAQGTRTDVVSRVFVPGAGIDEDSVTGSAHAALTPYWAEYLGRDSFTAHQASARGGDLACRLDGERAWLGGRCVTVVEGTFYV